MNSVLYVEDEPELSQIIYEFLNRRFDKVILAKDGEEGLEQFLEQQPDLVITDIRMPKVNGIEMIHSIRKVDTDTPIVLLSAYADEQFITDPIRDLVNGQLTKPLNEDEFTRVISSCIEGDVPTDTSVLIPFNGQGANESDISNPLHFSQIVGIGASAGGLEALTAFVSGLPMENEAVYIVAQHLSPTHKTMLVDLLSKTSELEVKNAEDGQSLEANVIYITPPNKNIEISADCKIVLSAPDKYSFLPKPSVNQLFMSLAEHHAEVAVGIILSGTGSDGAQGLRAISAAGGITIVQTPQTAKYDGMPKSAIQTSHVDMVLDAKEMGRELVALANFPRSEVLAQYETEHAGDDFSKIFNLLFRYKNVDFSVYKRTTLTRRLERRMIALKLMSLSQYLNYLEKNPEEVATLFNDLLIGVTSFFRDKAAFSALKKALRVYLAANQTGLDEFRVWIPGTSTGEEAYSVLITLKEVMAELNMSLPVRIFATDIDEGALNTARQGVYSDASMSEVSESILNKYFSIKDQKFEIDKELKNSIVFSYHNLIADPPFKNLDLVVCRNLLIYFSFEAQRQIMPTLHYGLKDHGLMFLGSSENITNFEHLFLAVDAKSKLYKQVPSEGKRLITPRISGSVITEQVSEVEKKQTIQATNLHDDVISEAAKLLLPNLIVLNEQFDIIYKKGKPDFLTLNDGYVSYNFFKMVDPRLAIDIRKAIKQAKETNQIAMTSLVQLDETRHLKTFVVPLARRLDDLYVLYFSELAQSELPTLYAEAANSDRTEDTKLLFELERTKEHMNTLVEELETSNEELQSTNEELQSANEELQSTNEELETSNEELQSTNEELQTAYAELKHLYDLNEQFKTELSETNLRYEKVLDSLNDAVTVSTIDGTIVRTNQAMQSLTGLHTHALLAKTWRDLVNEVEFISEARKQELVSKGIFGPYNVSISNAEGQERVLKVKDYLIKHSEKQHLIWTFASDVTFELESKKALEASEQKYRTIFNSADIGIAEVALNGSFRRVNKALCQFLGYSEQALLGTSLQEITYLNDVESRDDEQHPLINASDAKQEIRYFRADGNIVWGRTSVKRIIDNAEQSQDYLVISVEDIQEIKANMHRLEQAQVVFNATREAIMITDPNFIIQSVNEAFERTTGYLPKEAIGQSASILKSGKHAESFYQEMVRVIKQTGMFSGEIINKNKQGEFYPAFLNITSVTDKAGKLIQYIGVLTDISMLKESQQKINFLANHDTLTGLPNRSLFTDRLEHALEKAKRHNSNLAILFVDLDRFKVINDGLGHHVGDQVLVSISERFQQVLRNEDTIARIGGDEFIVILDDLRSPIDASKVAKTLIEEAERVVDVYEHSVNVGCSIGISIYPNDGHSTNELLRLADIAMYDAKAAGRSTYRFTSEAMSSDAFEKVTIENAIRDGLTNNEFELFFQPIVDMHTMDIAHAEALIRWNHPTMGLVMPGRFVPIAEESNLIVSISEFVVFEALKAMEQFESLAQHPIKVSINFSAKDFASMELFLKVKGYLEQQKIDASSLILELTERMLMKSDSQQQQLLQRYESLGMELAIDDFGTGYSNLNLLSEMRVDYLKIDRSFVERIGQDRASEELVKATIAIAKALGLKTIAEGIETEEQLNFLRDNDCDLGQGYYLYVPQSLPDMASILKP